MTPDQQIRSCPGWQAIEPHTLPASEFYDEPKRRGGGKSLYCKGCHRARMREYWKTRYYPEHAEHQKQAVTERRKQRKSETDVE